MRARFRLGPTFVNPASLLGAGVALVALSSIVAGAAASSGWQIQSTPNPPGAKRSYLYAVSCATTKLCTAVGSSSNASAPRGVTLAEHWDGASWKIQATPSPAGETERYSNGVSCAGAKSCVGFWDYRRTASGHIATVTERWNGTRWNVLATPNPGGTRDTEFGGVSCTAAKACTAVGDYTNGAGTEVPLAERWDGTSWSVQPTPSPAGAKLSLLTGGVSCTSTKACTAVGYYTPSNAGTSAVTLAERWNGTSWKIQSTPNPAGAGATSFSGVSCAAAKLCTAVGSYTNSAGKSLPFAERWNGTGWKVQSMPTPVAATNSFLNGVSCTAAKSCTAVGAYRTNKRGKSLTLAERWNGKRWTLQSTPNPAHAPANVLYAVSCTAVKVCAAVGSHTGANRLRTLAERHS